jgi:hypothetical protein
MAKFFDFRGRIAEANERRYTDWRERATAELYAENRNAITTFRDEALAAVREADGGNPHQWAVAESHQTEMLWRDKSYLTSLSDGNKTGSFTDEERKAAVARSRLHYKNDPLYIAAIDLTAAFIYGEGVSAPKAAADVGDTDKDKVSSLVTDFWHDDFNLRFLTGGKAQLSVCKRLLKDGEVPLIMNTETYRAVPVDCLDIVEVKEHSQMAGIPMLYKRQEGPAKHRWYWSAEAEVYKDDPSFVAERQRLIGVVGAESPIDDASVLILWRYGDGLRGYPPFYAALDWGGAHTIVAGNLQSYIKAVTAIVAKYKGQMTATDIARVKREVGSNLSQTRGLPPPTGSVRVEGQGGAEYSLLNVPAGGADIFKTGFEVSRLMVSADTGILCIGWAIRPRATLPRLRRWSLHSSSGSPAGSSGG